MGMRLFVGLIASFTPFVADFHSADPRPASDDSGQWLESSIHA
jgi:hypothetical protein